MHNHLTSFLSAVLGIIAGFAWGSYKSEHECLPINISVSRHYERPADAQGPWELREWEFDTPVKLQSGKRVVILENTDATSAEIYQEVAKSSRGYLNGEEIQK